MAFFGPHFGHFWRRPFWILAPPHFGFLCPNLAILGGRFWSILEFRPKSVCKEISIRNCIFGARVFDKFWHPLWSILGSHVLQFLSSTQVDFWPPLFQFFDPHFGRFGCPIFAIFDPFFRHFGLRVVTTSQFLSQFCSTNFTHHLRPTGCRWGCGGQPPQQKGG